MSRPFQGIAADEVPGLFNLLAPIYHFPVALLSAPARRRAHELAGVRDGERVLEIGVGTGLSFRRLLTANPSGVTDGIDRSPVMLKQVRRRAALFPPASYSLNEGDARSLPYPPGTFDIVLAGYVLDLLPEPDRFRVLQETERVLKPGGRLVAFHMTVGSEWQHRFWDRLGRMHPLLLGGSHAIFAAPLMERARLVVGSRETIERFGLLTEIVCAHAPLDCGRSITLSSGECPPD